MGCTTRLWYWNVTTYACSLGDMPCQGGAVGRATAQADHDCSEDTDRYPQRGAKSTSVDEAPAVDFAIYPAWHGCFTRWKQRLVGNGASRVVQPTGS